jgi:hypothetical protein
LRARSRRQHSQRDYGNRAEGGWLIFRRDHLFGAIMDCAIAFVFFELSSLSSVKLQMARLHLAQRRLGAVLSVCHEYG